MLPYIDTPSSALRFIGPPRNTKQSTTTEFPGRKQRRHYSVSTLLYREIGLLKNYAESRGPIPRNHSIEAFLSGQVRATLLSLSINVSFNNRDTATSYLLWYYSEAKIEIETIEKISFLYRSKYIDLSYIYRWILYNFLMILRLILLLTNSFAFEWHIKTFNKS